MPLPTDSSRWRLGSLLLGLLAVAPAQAAKDERTLPPPHPAETRLPAIAGNGETPNLDAPMPDISGEEGPVIRVVTPPKPEENALLFENLRRDPVVFGLVAEKPGLSFHKAMFVLPYSRTKGLRGSEAPDEAMFQISFKQRLLDTDLYFAYSQRSFWQVYDAERSRPFRETDYNPEFFYRYKPNDRGNVFGFDVGAEHESNGQNIPQSRSWNRLYGAGYWEGQQTLAYLKLWYRLPEDDDRAPDDPKRDDNPDILDYYGYGELQLQRNLRGWRRHRISLLARMNPGTGKGAINLNYSAPFGSYAFWNVYVWQGYGESLIDYDREVLRVGVGLMFSR